METNLTSESGQDLKNATEIFNKIVEEGAQGALFHSRMQWHNKGEHSTKFFLNRKKVRSRKHTMTGVYLEDDQLTCNQLEILKKQAKFYKKLFKSNKDIKFVLQNDTNIRIMDIDKALLEEDLTLDKIFKAMKSMSSQISPGCDGLTVELFKCF